MLMYRLLLDPTEGSGGGGGSNLPDPNDPNALVEGYRKRLQAANKDASSLARSLYGENVGLLRQIAQLKDQINSGVVLSADDAKQWQAFKALGTAADVAKRLEAGDTATTRLAERDRTDAIAKAAGVHGWGEKASVIARFLPTDATLEIKEAKDAAGKATKTATITPRDGKATPLPEYLQSEHPDLFAMLGEGQTPGAPRRPSAGAPPAPSSRRNPPPPGEGQGSHEAAIERDLISLVGPLNF